MSFKYAVTGDKKARAEAVEAFKAMLWLEKSPQLMVMWLGRFGQNQVIRTNWRNMGQADSLQNGTKLPKGIGIGKGIPQVMRLLGIFILFPFFMTSWPRERKKRWPKRI